MRSHVCRIIIAGNFRQHRFGLLIALNSSAFYGRQHVMLTSFVHVLDMMHDGERKRHDPVVVSAHW
jgi:hypothetical protein